MAQRRPSLFTGVPLGVATECVAFAPLLFSAYRARATSELQSRSNLERRSVTGFDEDRHPWVELFGIASQSLSLCLKPAASRRSAKETASPTFNHALLAFQQPAAMMACIWRKNCRTIFLFHQFDCL